MKTSLRICAVFFLAGLLRAAAAMLLVAGQESDNLMIFDPASARFAELARFPKGSKPRTVAVSPQGEIFVGFSGGTKNIVRVLPGNPAVIKSLTQAIGKYGPGAMAFGADQLWVAGDTEHTIYQVNQETGALTTPEQEKNDDNVVGLAVADKRLFVAEYAQRSIMSYEIGASGRLTGAHHLVTKTAKLNKPRDMIIGPGGDVFVANLAEPTVIQFDKKSGVAVRTLVNLGFPGRTGVYGLAYAPDTRRFYLASGPNLFETDSNGVVLAAYSSPALRYGNGLALLAAMPAGFKPKLTATLKTSSVGLSIIGIPGEKYQVVTTTDFKKWQPVPTPDNPQQQRNFLDATETTEKQRVYRLELAAAGK
jgi:DNA-binding beta-propeller fold protein YncE